MKAARQLNPNRDLPRLLIPWTTAVEKVMVGRWVDSD